VDFVILVPSRKWSFRAGLEKMKHIAGAMVKYDTTICIVPVMKEISTAGAQ
jgi:hypothetical protein